jgi:hypothetical protein
MNKKIMKTIKALLFFFIIALSSCEKDSVESTTQEQQKVDGKIEYVTIDDVPFLKPNVQNFKSDNLSSPNIFELTSKKVSDSDLDLKHIIEYKGVNNFRSYSIPIKNNSFENGDYYFENLHVIKDGNKYESFIVRYNPTDDSKAFNFKNFTGKIEFFTDKKKPISTVHIQNGITKLADPAPPIEIEEDLGGGGGGGCPCDNSPSLISQFFSWVGNSLGSININISNGDPSNTGYVLVVTSPNIGTSGGTNGSNQTPNGGGSSVIIAPNEPKWPESASQLTMADLIAQRLGLDSTTKAWLKNTVNQEITQGIYDYMNDADTFEVRKFAYEIITILKNGGEIDFGYKVIVDKSLKENPNLYGVYTQLGKAPAFQVYLQKFDSNFSVANLKLSVDDQFKNTQDPLNWKSQAITLTPQNYLINIIINNDASLPGNIMKFPKIISALVFIHEMMHAEINRILLTCSKLPNVNTQNMTDAQWVSYLKNMQNNFFSLYELYVKYQSKTNAPNPYQHQYMAQKYRNVIKEVLKQYDGNQHSEDFYDTISWFGLKGTTAWNNLSQAERDQINVSLQNIYQNEPYFN